MYLLLYLLFGYSSFSGGSGTFNLYSARTLPMANISFNMNLAYAQHSYPSTLEYSKSHNIGISKIGLTYGIIDYIEFYLGTSLYLKLEQRGGFSEPKDIYAFGDKDIFGGLKFYYPLVRGEEGSISWLVGGNIRGDINPFRSSTDSSLCEDQHFEPTLKHSRDIAIDFLSDIEVYPLFLHANVGYELRGGNYDIPDFLIPNTVYFLQGERSNLLRWGVGIEIAAGAHTRFLLETSGSNPLDNGNGTDTLIATFGLRFMASENFNFDIGVDYVLGEDVDFVPDWEEVVGVYESRIEDFGKWRFKVGFSVKGGLMPEKRKEKPKKGVIALSVNDIETDMPIVSFVSFQDTTLGVFETGQDGKINISLSPGVYHLRISKEGYITREASVTVKPDAEVNISTVLRKKVEPKGVFTGTVSSYRERIPLLANIEFLGTKLKSIVSDPEKGVFNVELPPGTYNVNVSSDGYLPKTFPIEIKDGETTINNIQLVEKLEEKKRLILTGVNFATNKAIISPEGYAILDKIVEILNANKDVKVEIGGHSDAVGAASYNQKLSESRALSVMQYLIQQGIEPLRLTSKGYGESMPIAPNTTREGRSQNRRIEFKVISE